MPGRVTYEALDGQTMTLLNAHRLRLVLSQPLQGRLRGNVTVKNAPMFQGQYAVPAAVEAKNVRCDGTGIGCPAEGIAAREPVQGHRGGRYVGAVEAAEDGMIPVGVATATDFEGTTDVVFEDVDATVAFQTFEPTEEPVQNYSLSAAAAVPTGRMVAVPRKARKRLVGIRASLDDDRYRIPPAFQGAKWRSCRRRAYGERPASNTPQRWFEHTGQGPSAARGG